MDYFQGVVAEYLRAKRSRFVNVEYLINLDRHGYRKDRHWYCDAVAVDFEDSTVRLCEITYSKTLQSVFKRLQSWCNHWPEIVTAVRRDSQLKGDWNMLPEVFVPGELKTHLDDRIAKLKWPSECSLQMPKPKVTLLEDVLPWKYRAWNGKPFTTQTVAKVLPSKDLALDEPQPAD